MAAPAEAGGDYVVCYAKMNERVAGVVGRAAFFNGRFYLFPGGDQKKQFLAHPAAYANADLALGGNCAVCKVYMKHDTPGNPEITVIHQGLRYQFPAEKMRDMFLANPAKYAQTKTDGRVSQDSRRGEPADSRFATVDGRSSCAGCEHGVAPLGDPETLGLAIEANDGWIYVVEKAHKLYPQVYQDRFDRLPLRVSGKVLKQQDHVAWLAPSNLEVLTEAALR